MSDHEANVSSTCLIYKQVRTIRFRECRNEMLVSIEPAISCYTLLLFLKWVPWFYRNLKKRLKICDFSIKNRKNSNNKNKNLIRNSKIDLKFRKKLMLKNAIKIEIGGTPDFFEMFKNLHPLHFSEQICAPDRWPGCRIGGGGAIPKHEKNSPTHKKNPAERRA